MQGFILDLTCTCGQKYQKKEDPEGEIFLQCNGTNCMNRKRRFRVPSINLLELEQAKINDRATQPAGKG